MDFLSRSDYTYPLAAGFFTALLAWSVYLWLLPKPIPNVPHNPVTSIWGDVPDIMRFTAGGSRTFAQYIADFVSKHGPLCQIMIGRAPMVLVADKAEIERVVLRGKNTEQLKRTNDIFATIIPTAQISLPTSMSFLHASLDFAQAPALDEMWKRHRRLTGPSMSRRYLGRMSARTLAEAQNLVRLWSCKAALGGGKAFDADVDLQMSSLDAIVNITIGASPQCLGTAYTSPLATASINVSGPNVAYFSHSDSSSLHSTMRVMMRGIERVSSAAFPALAARLFLWTSPTWRKSYNNFTQFFSQEIVRARGREHETAETARVGSGLATDADCVLDMLLQRESREGTEKLSQRELLDELLTYVIAGQDSTSSALGWLVKFLASDAEVQRQLHEEMCAAVGPDSEIEYNLLDDAGQVPVLEAVVAETLRCANVGSLTGRELLSDEVILGRYIPKGTQIMFPIAYMGTRESDWGPDAKMWRPSRWLRSDGSFNRKAGPSMVFGLGQRSCFGERLAIMQIKVFAATLSRSFFFKPVPPEVNSWDAVQVVTRQPKYCYVSLEKWSSNM